MESLQWMVFAVSNSVIVHRKTGASACIYPWKSLQILNISLESSGFGAVNSSTKSRGQRTFEDIATINTTARICYKYLQVVECQIIEALPDRTSEYLPQKKPNRKAKCHVEDMPNRMPEKCQNVWQTTRSKTIFKNSETERSVWVIQKPTIQCNRLLEYPSFLNGVANHVLQVWVSSCQVSWFTFFSSDLLSFMFFLSFVLLCLILSPFSDCPLLL